MTTLDEMTAGYLEAVDFTESEPMQDSAGEDVEILGFAAEMDEQARDDCAQFLDLLARMAIDWSSVWDARQLGIDFWFTRNHHGCGFWERGGHLGDILTKWADSMGEVDVYEGDDNWAYFA